MKKNLTQRHKDTKKEFPPQRHRGDRETTSSPLCTPCLRGKFLFFVVSLCLCVRPNFAADEHDPAAELASFTIAPGFEVNLFASEKDGVVKPIQIRFDPQGRIWVIGSTVYPQLEPGQIPNDKVLVLEDTDRDGRCDKTTVFADGLMIPTGIELGDGGVYVGHGTELLFLKDTNGDLKADERRVVLRGFGTGDNHQNINSFLWGPGGELWFCQGLHTHSNVETPWGIVRMNQAGLWRFRPKLKKLEGFYGSHFEPQNPWGYVFTDWGEPIVIAGNNSSMIYPVPGLTSRHFDLAPHQIWKNGGGRKSSGADIVGTTHFPDEWQGVLITGGYINNAVWALDIHDDGSGFALTDRDPLIKSTSRNFRPVDVKFGPDGSLYICDWYNPIIGHYQASFRHPDRDKTHGRIWRVTAKGRPLTTPPDLAAAPIKELLEHLKSPDRWTRHFAKRELSVRDGKAVEDAITKSIGTLSPLALKEALGVLQSHEILNQSGRDALPRVRNLLERLAVSTEPGARAYAASAIGRWADRLPDPLALLQPAASDPNPRVRLHAIVASSYIPERQALEIAARAAMHPTDKFIDYALRQAVFALKPHWQAAIREGQFDPGAKEEFITLFLRVGEVGSASQAAQNFVQSNADPARRIAVGRALIAAAGTSYLQGLFALPEGEVRRALMSEFLRNVKQKALKPDFHGHTETLLRVSVQQRNPNALRLAGIWRIESLRADVETAARDPKLGEETRVAAIEAFGEWKDAAAKSLLTELSRDKSSRVRAAVISAMCGIDLHAAAALVNQVEINPTFWPKLFTDFLQREGGAAALAKAFTERPPDKLVAATGLHIMNSTGRRDDALVEILNAAAKTKLTKLTAADAPALVNEVRANGNAARGEQVYRRAELGCVNCHSVKGVGGKLGPDLGALGTAQPIDFIIGAILDPQREVKEGFTSLSVTTKHGEEFQGYSIRENGSEIVLRDILLNDEVTIPKSTIAQRRQSGSIMPAGLTDTLTRQDFIDLIKYLSELGR